MIDPHKLMADMEKTLAQLHELGPLTFQRVEDWLRIERLGNDSNRGGGVAKGGKSDDRRQEELDDEQASAYFPETDTLTRRIEADMARLRRIIAIANPNPPKAAPDAGCRSCYRNGGQYEPVWDGRYRDACRFCAEWRTAHDGEWPPISIVRWRHRHPGKRVPVQIVEKAG